MKSFQIKDDELLEKYNEIAGKFENREKVENRIKKEVDNEPIYNAIYLQAKIKSYNGRNQQNFSQ